MQSSDQVLVFGAGNFGTCLAQHLANKGLDVGLWARRAELAEAINKTHKNPKYLKEISLNTKLWAFSEINAEKIGQAKAIILAIPTQSLKEFIARLKPFLNEDQLLVSTAKGIEVATSFFPSQIIEAGLGKKFSQDMVTLSGPSFAAEVAIGQPTGLSAASKNMTRARWAQDLFHTPVLRVYTHEDPIGLEVAGALKNVIAIAAGAGQGLGFQANAHAILLTRGLAEMARLGTALGADPLTFNGLGGVGDLILTCSSEKSRNFKLGWRLAKGEPLDQVLGDSTSLAEGYGTAKAAIHLTEKLGVDVPITRAVYEVLFTGKKVEQAVFELMNRSSKHE